MRLMAAPHRFPWAHCKPPFASSSLPHTEAFGVNREHVTVSELVDLRREPLFCASCAQQPPRTNSCRQTTLTKKTCGFKRRNFPNRRCGFHRLKAWPRQTLHVTEVFVDANSKLVVPPDNTTWAYTSVQMSMSRFVVY